MNILNFLPLPLLVWMLAIRPAPRETYTVSVGNLFHETNCVSVTKHEPGCTLVTYLDARGQTNEFHAWLVTVKVETNGVSAASQPKRAEGDAIRIEVGPGTELRVTIPNLEKDDVIKFISSLFMQESKAGTNFDALLGKSSALTLILTTKPSPDAPR